MTSDCLYSVAQALKNISLLTGLKLGMIIKISVCIDHHIDIVLILLYETGKPGL